MISDDKMSDGNGHIENFAHIGFNDQRTQVRFFKEYYLLSYDV